MAGARRDGRPRQEFNVVMEQRLRIKSQIFRIGRDHLKGFHARWHARHVAEFNGLHMVGMNARGFTGILKSFATLFTLALQEPAGFSGGIACAIWLFTEAASAASYSVSSRPNSSCGSSMVLLSRAPSINYLLTLLFERMTQNGYQQANARIKLYGNTIALGEFQKVAAD